MIRLRFIQWATFSEIVYILFIHTMENVQRKYFSDSNLCFNAVYSGPHYAWGTVAITRPAWPPVTNTSFRQ